MPFEFVAVPPGSPVPEATAPAEAPIIVPDTGFGLPVTTQPDGNLAPPTTVTTGDGIIVPEPLPTEAPTRSEIPEGSRRRDGATANTYGPGASRSRLLSRFIVLSGILVGLCALGKVLHRAGLSPWALRNRRRASEAVTDDVDGATGGAA